MIFESQTRVEVTQWNPHCFTAPARMSAVVPEWQQFEEAFASARRFLLFELSDKAEWFGVYENLFQVVSM